MEQYYAKSKQFNGKQTTNQEHLINVADLAKQFGADIGIGQEAETAGLFHDFGKYTDYFQDILTGLRQSGDHAIGGAIMLYPKAQKNAAYQYILEVIAGHHSGLLEFDLLKNYLEDWLKTESTVTPSGKTNTLQCKTDLITARNAFQQDFPAYRPPKLSPPPFGASSNIEKMLYSRMLFSCLVDADYTISANDEDENYLKSSENTDFDANNLLAKLYQYKQTISDCSSAKPEVNELREKVFYQCGAAGDTKPGLFTLTAPTGTGKTLALLHFALRHCIRWKKKRIIIVLPFLTLTEQNAKVYRNIVPTLLEDHSQSDLSDEERVFSERWSTPVILTTSVRFFETLFAYKPGDCRKLHSIANSVVIFDEAQSLPAELTTATLKSVSELCLRYRTTMVFSTATQPDYSALSELNGNWSPTEILPDHDRLYQSLRRTRVEWNLETETPLAQIAAEMSKETSVCAIVNLRNHARELFSLLNEYSSTDEVFFLTTDLCAAHRRKLVETINQRLKEHLPCRLVATQCIEAGVDFDFDVLYRALAPLDSIIQAAGRCNRNGRLTDGGRVVVFVPEAEGRIYPGDWYENAASKVKILDSRHKIDIYDPSHIKEYYELLFRNANDKKALRDAILDHSFSETAKAYKLIESKGVQVIVPYNGKLELFRQLKAEGEEIGVTPSLLKRAAPIMVAVSFRQLEKLEQFAEALNYADLRHSRCQKQKSQVFVLRNQHFDLYSDDMGLQFPQKVEFDGFW